jgi:2-polyprenyl-3-methyl-5-hydroxy-6-metoxy-1,4-benzoquinol methylase
MSERPLEVPSEPARAPERFDPVQMRGSIIEAEHRARYHWASSVARGRRVLDAGCGMAYGSALLAAAGASDVTGVDWAEEVLDDARRAMPAGVELVAGDVTDLGFDDGAFDLIVSFEVIEHLDQPDLALDEFRRLLAPGGLLVVSSPNRDVYTPGNPHHVHEYTPAELHAAIAGRFAHVAMRRQHTWVASSVLDDELASREAGKETYTIAIASDAALPLDQAVVTLSEPVELRTWDSLWHEQRDMLEEQEQLLHEQEQLLHEQEQVITANGETMHSQHLAIEYNNIEIGELRRQLVTSERELAAMHDLAARVKELARRNDELANELDATAQRLDHLEQRSDSYQVIVTSKSWQLTRPLRGVAAVLRKFAPRG